MITIKIGWDKTRANFARKRAGPQCVVQPRGDKRWHDYSWTHVKQVAHQGTLRLDNCRAATELCTTKNDAGPPFLSWFSGLVISHRETELLPAPGEMIQFLLDDELYVVSSAAPSGTRETRCVAAIAVPLSAGVRKKSRRFAVARRYDSPSYLSDAQD